MTAVLTTAPPYSGGLPWTEWCPKPEKFRLRARRTRDALLGRQVLYLEPDATEAMEQRVVDWRTAFDANPDANLRESSRNAAHTPAQ